MNNTIYPLAVIGVIAVVTWALRAFPFLLFGNRPLPKVIRYLGKALPPAIMTVLVIYCLRDISFSQSPFGFCNHRFAVTERNIKLWAERQIWKTVCFAK